MEWSLTVSQAPSPFVQSSPAMRPLGGNAIAVASMITWAAGFPAAELLLETWSPTALITARLALVGLLMLPLWWLLDGGQAVRRAPWTRGLVIGGLAFGIGAWLMLVAQAFTDAVTVAIIASACPVAAVFCEMVLDGRRLSRAFAFGLVATVAGGVLATGGGGVALGIGAALAVVACFLFSLGSMMTVRALPDLTAVGRTALTLTGGAIAMIVVTFAGELAGWQIVPTHTITSNELGLLAIFAFVGMALSQALWLSAVSRLGVALAAFHINIAPFYVMILMLALGGGWDWQAAFGAAVVALGVLVAQRG